MSGAPDDVEALVLGDSSANSLYPGIAEMLAGRGVGTANVGMVLCAPVRGVDGRKEENRSCRALNERAYAFALEHPRVRWILLGFTPWDFTTMSFPGPGESGGDLGRASNGLGGPHADERALFDAAARRLADDIAALRHAGKTVVVSVDVPYLDSALYRCRDARFRGAGEPEARRACRVPVGRLLLRVPYLGWWREALGSLDVCLFDQTDAFLDTDGEMLVADAGGLLFRDSHHLSRHGSRRVAASLLASRCSPIP
jgi:SGNH domain-containing protein